jgi:hypothetical protein
MMVRAKLVATPAACAAVPNIISERVADARASRRMLAELPTEEERHAMRDRAMTATQIRKTRDEDTDDDVWRGLGPRRPASG